MCKSCTNNKVHDSHYICEDCKSTEMLENYFGKAYSVKTELWNKYGNGDGMLCLKCFEKRLGRKLITEDFIECPLTFMNEDYWKIVFDNINYKGFFSIIKDDYKIEENQEKIEKTISPIKTRKRIKRIKV